MFLGDVGIKPSIYEVLSGLIIWAISRDVPSRNDNVRIAEWML